MMKRAGVQTILVLLLSLLVIGGSGGAVSDAIDPADTTFVPSLNATINAGSLQPVVDVVRPLIVKLSLLVGGIFGLYLILILARVYYEQKTYKTLQQIRYDLDHLNQHFGIPSSRERLGFFHRWILDKIYPSHARKHQLSLLRRGKK